MRANEFTETIRKVKGGYRLVSHTGKNLGTYPSHAGAEKRERQVQYFKHANEANFAGQEVEGNPLEQFKDKFPNLSTVMYFIPGLGQALMAADIASQIQMYNQALAAIEKKYPMQTIQSVQQKVGDDDVWEPLD